MKKTHMRTIFFPIAFSAIFPMLISRWICIGWLCDEGTLTAVTRTTEAPQSTTGTSTGGTTTVVVTSDSPMFTTSCTRTSTGGTTGVVTSDSPMFTTSCTDDEDHCQSSTILLIDWSINLYYTEGYSHKSSSTCWSIKKDNKKLQNDRRTETYFTQSYARNY